MFTRQEDEFDNLTFSIVIIVPSEISEKYMIEFSSLSIVKFWIDKSEKEAFLNILTFMKSCIDKVMLVKAMELKFKIAGEVIKNRRADVNYELRTVRLLIYTLVTEVSTIWALASLLIVDVVK